MTAPNMFRFKQQMTAFKVCGRTNQEGQKTT